MVKVVNEYMHYFFLYIFVIINKKSLSPSGQNVVGARCVIRIRFQTKFFSLKCDGQIFGASRLKMTELLNQFLTTFVMEKLDQQRQ